MSDTPSPKEAVTDELTDQVDVGSLVSGDSVSDQVDGASLGRTFGESVGALAGRQLGRVVVGRVASKLGLRDDEGDRSSFGRLASAFVVALGRTLSQPQFREPIEDALRGYVEQREAAEKTLDEAKETAEEAAEMAEETVEDGADEASDAAEESTDEATDAASTVDASDLDPDDVQAIREETYRDLLETMEYSELQSLAKEVDVKANLQHDELVDAIVEEFNDESETSEDEDADEE
ncbi:hypothetical protein [Haladaptatus sp. NG-WS-4]